MKSILFDEYGNLNIEELIADQPTFQKIVEDGVVTQEEIDGQAKLVTDLLLEFEKSVSPDVVEKLRKILAELCVLVAIQNRK